MTQRSKTNLIAAMKCDALDAAKYRRFAARARMEEDWQLANAFQETEESDETLMFARFAQQAKEDGDLAIGSLFEAISRDKAARRAKFDDPRGNGNSQQYACRFTAELLKGSCAP